MQERVLITGASSGIGLEFSHVYAEHGHDLVLVARSKNALTALANELADKHRVQVAVIPIDLSQPNAAEQLVSELENRDLPVDILINNAGFGLSGPFVSADSTETSGMIAVNITALTELTQLIAPQMKQRGQGKILNVSSAAGFQASPYLAVYAATKAYVLQFSEAIAEELAPFNITVTVLCPGVTRTGFVARAKLHRVSFFNKEAFSMKARDVAEIGYKALQKGTRVVICGPLNQVLVFLGRLIPRKWANKFVSYMNRPAKK